MEHPPQKTTSNLLYPLERFYIDTSLPHVEHCYPDTMPQSYKNLLVHTNDMTSTLANFHHEGISLQVLDLQNSAGALYRKVLLIGDDSARPVEFGAIKINLDSFAPEPRKEIGDGKRPLGSIFQKYNIDHHCDPFSFISVLSDSIINAALKLEESQILFGRRNKITDSSHNTLAEVVEILPPIKDN